MKWVKRSLIILLCTGTVLTAVFIIGRYGWKIGGFNYCESAGIEKIEAEEGHVRICGFYPGSFPQGFLGYHAEQIGDTLYVGFKFSGIFGVFENGDFDITIPIEGSVNRIFIKSGENEYPVSLTENED